MIEIFRKVMEEMLPEKVYMGIDSGATGAIGIIVRNKAFVADIPTLKIKRKGGSKTEFNLPEIAKAFLYIKKYRSNFQVILEEALVQVGGKGANAYTGFRVGVAFGMWPLFLTVLGFSFERVSPITWKSKMGLRGKGKEDSRLKALGMFPQADILRKKDHNRAEALLLAEYHCRCLTGRMD